jgi:hypothetical protein
MAEKSKPAASVVQVEEVDDDDEDDDDEGTAVDGCYLGLRPDRNRSEPHVPKALFSQSCIKPHLGNKPPHKLTRYFLPPILLFFISG